jgi:mRNA interferase MazF
MSNYSNNDFDKWNTLKKYLNSSNKRPFFKEREIWWLSQGVNVGFELNGKNQLYERPVLVLKKFNSNVFLGIPFSTQIKTGPYYSTVNLHGKDTQAILSHIKLYDTQRLIRRLIKIPTHDYDRIKEDLKRLLF